MSYAAAQHNKWLDEIFAHLPRINETRKTEVNGEILSISEIAKNMAKQKFVYQKDIIKENVDLNLFNNQNKQVI